MESIWHLWYFWRLLTPIKALSKRKCESERVHWRGRDHDNTHGELLTCLDWLHVLFWLALYPFHLSVTFLFFVSLLPTFCLIFFPPSYGFHLASLRIDFMAVAQCVCMHVWTYLLLSTVCIAFPHTTFFHYVQNAVAFFFFIRFRMKDKQWPALGKHSSSFLNLRLLWFYALLVHFKR